MSFDPSSFLGISNGLQDEPDDLAWLAGLLREMMSAVAAEEGDIMKKAGMVARLGSLFLRASKAAELKRAYKELARRNAELEERLTALEACAAEREAPLHPAPTGPAKSSEPVRCESVDPLTAMPAAVGVGRSFRAPAPVSPPPLVPGALQPASTAPT
jgi:hypothetical protein